MHAPQVLAALAALAGFAIATPVNDVRSSGSFSLPQVHKGYKFKNGPGAVEEAFRKYKAPVPEGVSAAAAAAAAQQGSVTANPEQFDRSYLCTVSVGSNTLSMDFDSGSSDFWVFSTELPAAKRKGHTVYTLGGTKKTGYTWKIRYGDGSGASGNVYVDKVVIGGVTATAQAVEAATSVSTQFVKDKANDGLVGLAFSTGNMVKPQKQLTFFDNVKSSLTQPLWAAYLRHQAPGAYDFGFLDSSKYTGSITYTNVNSGRSFWEFTGNGYSVGNGAVTSQSLDLIADTGTSIMLLPKALCAAYYKQVSGAKFNSQVGGYIFPCSATLPDLNIVIGSYTAVVTGSLINYAPVSSTLCYGGLQSSAGLGLNVLGDVFFKNQYVVFKNSGSPQLGFAQAV